jgi:hypothetical protein
MVALAAMVVADIMAGTVVVAMLAAVMLAPVMPGVMVWAVIRTVPGECGTDRRCASIEAGRQNRDDEQRGERDGRGEQDAAACLLRGNSRYRYRRHGVSPDLPGDLPDVPEASVGFMRRRVTYRH